jgi:hypothetical protein
VFHTPTIWADHQVETITNISVTLDISHFSTVQIRMYTLAIAITSETEMLWTDLLCAIRSIEAFITLANSRSRVAHAVSSTFLIITYS